MAVWYKRLTTQISLFALVSTLITATAVAGVALHTSYEFLLQRIERELPLRLQAAAAKVDQWYVQRMTDVQVFARSPMMSEALARYLDDRDRSGEELQAFLGLLLGNSPNFRAMLIADSEGRIYARYGEAINAEIWLAELSPGVTETAVSGVRWIDGEPSQILSLVVGDGSLRPKVAFYAVARLSELKDILATTRQGTDAELFVLDGDENIVLGSAGSTPDRSPGWVSRGLRELVRFDNYQGEALIGSAASLPAMNGLLVIEQSQRSLFNPLVREFANTIGLTAGIVLILCLMAYRMARAIARPIGALTEGAQRMRLGETDLRIPCDHNANELGCLTDAFNSMASELHKKTQEIESANARLHAQNEQLNTVNDQLYRQSVTDDLTQIHNQRYFREQLWQLVARAKRNGEPLCLMLIDVDCFKNWNDRHGHAVGDEILRRLANLILEQFRVTDVVARYAGDEFVVLLPDTELAGAKRLAGQLQQVVRQLKLSDIEGANGPASVSIGVAMLRENADQLFIDADRALYVSKEKGRDSVTSITEVLSRRSCA